MILNYTISGVIYLLYNTGSHLILLPRSALKHSSLSLIAGMYSILVVVVASRKLGWAGLSSNVTTTLEFQ